MSRADFKRESDGAFASKLGCIGKRGIQVCFRQTWITRDDLVAIDAGGEIIEEYGHHDSGAADAWAAVADVGIHGNAFAPVLHDLIVFALHTAPRTPTIAR